jgi:hypothetical protein
MEEIALLQLRQVLTIPVNPRRQSIHGDKISINQLKNQINLNFFEIIEKMCNFAPN